MNIAQNLRELLGSLGIGKAISQCLKLLGCNHIVNVTVVCCGDKSLDNRDSQELTLGGVGNAVTGREAYSVTVGTENFIAIGVDCTNLCRRQKIKLALKMSVVGVLLHRP